MRIARNLEQLDTPHFKKFQKLLEARCMVKIESSIGYKEIQAGRASTRESNF